MSEITNEKELKEALSHLSREELLTLAKKLRDMSKVADADKKVIEMKSLQIYRKIDAILANEG